MKAGQWALEVDRPAEALEAIDLALEQLKLESRASSEEAWQFTQFKAFALIRMGQNKQAMEALQPFAESLEPEDDARLNGWAYVAALAGEDLELAHERVDLALAKYRMNPAERAHRVALDAWDAQDYELAETWIDRAIGDFETIHRQFQEGFSDQIAALAAAMEADDQEVRREITRLRSERDLLNRRRAMMHALRAKVREKRGQTMRAQADQRVVEELGFEVDNLVGLRFVEAGLSAFVSYLDTRAWILHRMGQNGLALKEIDLVIELGTARLAIDEAEMQRISKQIVHADLLNREMQEAKRMVAVFYYHRAQIHRNLGNELHAFADDIQIRRLGFEPGEHLF